MDASGGVEALSDDPVTVQPDADAVDAALAGSGDVRAFERLYRRHVTRVHSLARRMIGEEEADDATQDVFIRAWNRLDSFRGEAAFGTWLHRVAINALLARRARRGRERERVIEGDGLVEQMPARRDDLELHVDFETAIARLPDGARRVFVLHDIEGFKHREIAEMLGVTPGTSKAQLHRARLTLRRHLER